MDADLIDWARVNELRAEIGDEDFAEVAEMFLEEVSAMLAHLTGSAETGALEENLHFLKSSALNLGFAEMARLCSAGERAAAEGRGATVDLGAVQAVFDRSLAAYAARSGTSPETG